jgi:hypothetical protein
MSSGLPQEYESMIITDENSELKMKSDYVKSYLNQEYLQSETEDTKISSWVALVSSAKVKNAMYFEELFQCSNYN